MRRMIQQSCLLSLSVSRRRELRKSCARFPITPHHSLFGGSCVSFVNVWCLFCSESSYKTLVILTTSLITGKQSLSYVEIQKPRPEIRQCLVQSVVLWNGWQERQQQDQEMKVKEAELVRGNPLLNPTSFTVKRRYDEFWFDSCLAPKELIEMKGRLMHSQRTQDCALSASNSKQW
jgi:hypothetical protein